EKVILVKPQTFMNLSGESLREIVNFYKIEPDHLIVVYDDIDLATGQLRIKPSGSSGTHNGMKSVIYQLQFDNFPRIRIGLGKDPNMPLAAFVISSPSSEEQKLLDAAIENAADAVTMIVQGEINAAMNKYNTKNAD
ncbi:MAG: aminoacyl-tRNA hydrolase, partial [Bacillota bacterium]|nr:aminoacyl-tRNA hydrolase [Bacillota bacterium]